MMTRQLFLTLLLAIAVKSPLLAAPVPLNGTTPVPLDRLRVNNPAVLPMTGIWRFKLEHGGSPAVNGVLPVSANAANDSFATTGLNDQDWKDIPVPANWEIEGFSMPTFQNRGNNVSDDIGLYRRWVSVPAGFSGKTVLWHFDGVYDGAEVWVNGQRAGYHESGFTAFDIDVTRALQPGKSNLFAVRVYKKTPSGSMDKGDFWCLGGIYRDNYLVALPPVHIDDVTITTDLDANYKDATLKAVVRVVCPAGTTVGVSGELYGVDGQKVSIPGRRLPVNPLSGSIRPEENVTMGEGEITVNGSADVLTVGLEAPVQSPKLWSAEKPNLYYVVFTLTDFGVQPAQPNRTELVQERFGFRKIENRNGVLLWNGVPIKCTGTCRHEEFSPYGHALTEECWKTDIALMKAANINSIRTSHYNHSARFLELCDEAGFYVLDEVPFCWVSDDPQFSLRNTNAVWAFLLRSRETLARDKNRPCVLAWSMGNESGYGPNAQTAFDYMKANDPTRLAYISQQNLGQNPRTDFEDYHYPSPDALKQTAASPNRSKVPVILTEEPHTFCVRSVMDYDYGSQDFWGQALVNIWDVVWPAKGIAGSWIWEWQDQGMADKFPDRRGVDAATGMREENYKGIVTSDRKLKPAYWSVKMVYSPVTTAAREVVPANGRCVVPIQNRYSFTDLSELTCRWQALAGGKELARGDSHVACAPQTSTEASFPATAGMDTLRLEFIHPDGRSIYATTLRAPAYQPPVPPPALVSAEPVRLSEAGPGVVVETAGTRLELDKQTGQIASWRAGGQDVVLGGPILNLGEGELGATPARGGGGGRGRGGSGPISNSQPPRLTNAVVTAKMDGAVAKISVTADVYLAGSDERKGQLHYTLDIGADAQADVAWNLDWKATNAGALEAGLKFLLPSSTDRMTWLSENLWTEYPPDHIGNPSGSAMSTDLSFRSSKRNVHWMTLSGGGKYCLVALRSGKPLHGRGRVDANGTMLFLSSAIGVPSGYGANAVPGYDIRLTPETPISGAFRLRVAAKP
jgi:beta-galactosidase